MTTARDRLVSLDALRGFTIMGMIVVNSPGSWSHVFPPLLHKPWHGATITDLVFPFFLFIVGVSISFAYTSKPRFKRDRRAAYRKIGIRAVKLFLLGVFLNLWPTFDFSELRWVGVLQRIAIVFAVCALLYLKTDWKTQFRIGAGVLVAYWAILSFVPVPLDAVNEGALQDGAVERAMGSVQDVSVEANGTHFLKANLEPGANLQAWLDRKLIPGSMWERTWDPEGLLSTFPAICTGIFGMLVGCMVRSIGDPYRRVSWLFFVGTIAVLASGVWSWVFPLNKNLWSSSFVLYSGGWATLCFAVCLLLIDVLGHKNWAKVGIVFGANPLVAYALSSLLVVVFYSSTLGWPSLGGLFVDLLMNMGIKGEVASLAYALLYLWIIYFAVRWLWIRKIFVKL